MPDPLHHNDLPATYPDSWYAASAPIARQRPGLHGDRRADVCIVGAGLCGLTAALHLAQAGLSVIVLEAHRAGWGASGRNGGQVGAGFNTDMPWLRARLGDGPARALWDMTEEAKQLLRTLAAAHAPDAPFKPGVAHAAWSASEARALHATAEDLARRLAEHPVKGECVVLIAPGTEAVANDEAVRAALVNAMETMRVKDAATAVAGAMGRPRREVYQMALALKDTT